MSLRRRITVAVALAVAAVAVGISVAGYASTRSHLVGEVQQELRKHAAPYLQPRGPEAGNAQEASGGGRDERGDHHAEQGFRAPPPPKFGGARGYFQVVHPDGTTTLPTGESVRLPVTPRAVETARRAKGSFFMDATVRDVHLEVLTVGDRFDHWAVQVALPLTSVDSVLDP